MPETASYTTLYVALTLSIQTLVIVTHTRRREPFYEFLRGINFLLLCLPLLLGLLLHLLYTIFIIRPAMSLHVWLFRRLLYQVLVFSGVIGSMATASAWVSTYIVFTPLCVSALLVLVSESSIVVYEYRYNKVAWWRARGTNTHMTSMYTLEEEDELFEEG
jgi:hypothetical protein